MGVKLRISSMWTEWAKAGGNGVGGAKENMNRSFRWQYRHKVT